MVPQVAPLKTIWQLIKKQIRCELIAYFDQVLHGSLHNDGGLGQVWHSVAIFCLFMEDHQSWHLGGKVDIEIMSNTIETLIQEQVE